MASQVTFNGIENYKALLSDTQFHKSFLFTAKYALAVSRMQQLVRLFPGWIACQAVQEFRPFSDRFFFVPYAMSAFVLGLSGSLSLRKGFRF